MKLYAVSWREDEPTAQNQRWFGNKRSAVKHANDGYDGTVREVEVPTTRVALIEWLNENNWRR